MTCACVAARIALLKSSGTRSHPWHVGNDASAALLKSSGTFGYHRRARGATSYSSAWKNRPQRGA